MAEKQLIRTQNSWLGGISQDQFLGSDNQYEYSTNISYRNNIKGISLGPAPILRYTASSPIVKLYRDSNDNVRGFAQNGDIYKDNILVANNDPDGANLLYFNAIEFRPDKIVLIYFDSVYELDTTTNAVVLSFTFTPASNIYTKRAVTVAGDTIYWGTGNILYYTVSSIMGLPQVQYTAGENEEIYYLSQYLDQLKMYTFLGTNNGDTIQYMLHRGIVNQYQYKQTFPQVRLDYATTEGPYDYFVNLNNNDVSRLGVFSGPSYQYLYRETNQDGRISFVAGMKSKEGLTYVGGTSESITDSTSKSGVFISGKYLPQYPSSLNFLYVDDDLNNISDIEFGDAGIVIAKSNKVYSANNEGVLRRPTGTLRYSQEGILTSRKFYGDSMTYRKKIDEFWIAGDIPAGCSVDVYYSVDDGNRQFAQTITSATIESRRQRVFTNQIVSVNSSFNEKFHSCQYKLVLKGNGLTTPIIYEFNTFYSLIQN